MNHRRALSILVFGAAALAAAAPALAGGPQWMPGFPMRMGTNVMLMWAPIPGATGYNVYRSDKQDELGPLLTSLPANNYMDMNVPTDRSAYYTVKVVTSGAEGDASPVGALVAIKPLSAPKWIGHMQEEKAVVLRFDQVQGAAFYNVLRAEKKEGPFSLVASIQETKYTDPNVKEDNSYFYQVSAVDKNNIETPKSEIYVFKYEKKVVSAAAKAYTQVDILIKSVKSLRGPDNHPLAQPTILAMDGQTPVLYDLKSIVSLNPDTDTVVRDLDKPASYQGEWGRCRGLAVASDGTVLTTWGSGTQVRGLTPGGTVAFEFDLKKPTAEDYAQVNRQADWNEDKDLTPVPSGIAEDSQGRLWVGEPIFGQMHVYERNGTLLKRIGEPRVRGYDIKAVKSFGVVRFHKGTNRIYTVDPLLQTVRAYDVATLDRVKDKDGNPILGWKRPGGVPGGFQEPRGMAVLKDGNLLIADGIDGRLQVFDTELEYKGALVLKAGEPKPSDLGGPMDLAVDGNTLYVAEPLAQRVLVYNF